MSERRLTRFVAAYLFARTVLWTLLLFFTQPALPLDVLEHLAWGREWRLVYAHHPGLPAWINETLNLATGGSHLALSAAAPVSTSLAMAAVWLLARRVVGAFRAVVATLAVEGIYYFNVAATEFNHNVAQLAVCAWLCYFAHRAFLPSQQQAARGGGGAWALLGATAALSLYAKYSSALFLFALFAWSVAAARARKHWRTPGAWLALIVFALLTAPQIVELVNLNFAPLRFAAERAKEAARWTDHVAHPLRFLLAQLGATTLALLLCALALGKRSADKDDAKPFVARENANRAFIAVAALAPLALALLISLVSGWRFKSMWGAAMPTFIPLWLLMIFSSHELRRRRFYIGVLSAAMLAALATTIINVGAPYWSKRGKRVHYPASDIGRHVEAQWRANFDSSLRFVMGPKHMAALLSFYAPSRPAAIIDGDWKKNFWAAKEDFAQCGGVIAWTIRDGKNNDAPPPDYVKSHPTAQAVQPLKIRWDTAADIPPLEIGLLLVPPQGSGC